MKEYSGRKRKRMPKRTEKGFTLVELLVALTIATAIMGVLTASVITVMRTTAQNDEWNVNLRQVQNAGHWITRDTLMAQTVSDNTTGVFLALFWNDWTQDNNVKYYLNTDNLTRSLNNGKAILIAQYTDKAHTTCHWDAATQKLTVTIRASLHGKTYVEQTYQISPRTTNWGG